MIATQEKLKMLKHINEGKLEYFQAILSSVSYDDHDGFIQDFIQDTQYLFSFCNEKKYQSLQKNYEVQDNMFEPFV